MLEFLHNLDGNILLFFQDNIRNEYLTPVVKFITHLGDNGYIWIALAVLLLVFKKTRKAGIVVAVALIGSLIINNLILKNLVDRTRPYEVINGLNILIEKQSDASFPSGHSGSSFAAAVAIFMNVPKKYGIYAIIMAVLIALSRLYVGVHYPSDVFTGIATGIFIGIMSTILVKYIDNKRKMI